MGSGEQGTVLGFQRVSDATIRPDRRQSAAVSGSALCTLHSASSNSSACQYLSSRAADRSHCRIPTRCEAHQRALRETPARSAHSALCTLHSALCILVPLPAPRYPAAKSLSTSARLGESIMPRSPLTTSAATALPKRTACSGVNSCCTP